MSELVGVQERLGNLGHACEDDAGVLGGATRAAITAFQRQHDLEPTGLPDEATRARLVEVHGS